MKNVCVFLGSRMGNDPSLAQHTRQFGQVLARNNCRLVYGGGRVGLMGLLADEVLKAGGEVIGVIPSMLFEHEVGHKGLTQLYEVKTMHERKALMENLSEAFVALPGGFGTLDELCEIITWTQIGLHKKPIGLFNVNSFFDPFMAFIKQASEAGFIPEHNISDLIVCRDGQEMVERLFQ